MRPIDADALIHHFYETEYASMYYIEVVKRIIDEQPTLSPDDVRGVGEWIEHKPFDKDRKNCNVCIECSCCHTCFGHDRIPKTNYCPSCGARLGNGGTDDS